ncbi:ATP-dependent Clp protease adaptor ClpS [Bradyrhizobium sp. 138]|uniref:ATP-dependent Clp protease adaptor ClpS n=1 Tax=Bradyrhizobium sp. 138 TaxID=2782615 RepID=UPI001FFB216D|nr:ATP-dependent Clp protease adaptor ClpS [Bradyrhizobium sp. 138]
MNSMRDENQAAQLLIHNDDDTPDEFVIDLLRQVFGKPEREAAALIAEIERSGKAASGPYPQAVADALFKSAQQRISVEGLNLQITLETIKTPCELCDKPEGRSACGSGAAPSGCAATAIVRRKPERTHGKKNSTMPATSWTGILPVSRAASS